MVELVWKGKRTLKPANFKNTKIPAQHLCTFESYPAQSSEKSTAPSLNSTPTWQNRLILGDKSSILPSTPSRIYRASKSNIH